MEGYFALFNMDFFMQNNFPPKYLDSKKVLQVSGKPYINITDQHAAEVADIFETLLKEKESGKKHKEELIALKIIEVVIMSERLFDEEENIEINKPTMILAST